MHILIEALSARLGGGITRLVGLVQGMVCTAPQHRYSIVLSSAYQRQIIDALPPGVSIIDAVYGRNLVWRAWFQSVGLPRIARAIAADVVFAASEGAYLRMPVPLVMMCGNLLLFGPYARSGAARLRRPFIRRAVHVSSRIAFVSQCIRNVASADLRLPAEKSFVLHHGVDRRFRPQPPNGGAPYYLAVSSIAAHKGYDTLLDAYALLPREVPPLRIAGGTQEADTHRHLLELRARRGLDERVEFLGAVAPENLPALYANARALLFPSEVESFGLPLAEAMACGTPVVATDLPICREICGDVALYFPARDAAQLADRIATLDRDSHRRRELGEAGIVRAKRFTWEDAAQLLLAELEKLL